MFDPFSRDSNGPVVRKRRHYVLRDLSQSREGFGAEETTSIDARGNMLVETEVSLHFLECGDVVGSAGAAELCSACGYKGCTNALCFRCSDARCAGEGCGVVLCHEHRRTFEDKSYCPRCHRNERIKHGLLTGAVSFHRIMSSE